MGIIDYTKNIILEFEFLNLRLWIYIQNIAIYICN